MFNNPGNPHNPMMDGKGRVWFTHQIRGPGNPDWCREGSDNPFAKHYPRERAPRHVAYWLRGGESVQCPRPRVVSLRTVVLGKLARGCQWWETSVWRVHDHRRPI